MRRRPLARFAAALTALAALAGAANAKTPTLTAAEVRAELTGVELHGVVAGMDLAWRECIEPSGRTFYLRPGMPADAARDEGRLEITPAGALCFSYRSNDFASASCHWARREGDNYRFVSADGGRLVFLTTAVRRGVRSCDPARTPIS